MYRFSALSKLLGVILRVETNSRWNETHCFTKTDFPYLLRKAMEALQPNISQNLINGFKKCGIVPCDIQPLLDRFEKKVDDDTISEAFLTTKNY
jgi:hypothetical protein